MKNRLTKEEKEPFDRIRFYTMYREENFISISGQLFRKNENEMSNYELLMYKIIITAKTDFINKSKMELNKMNLFLEDFITQNPLSKTELLDYLKSINDAENIKE